MARDQAKVYCPVGVWTELTNSDTTNIAFQVIGGSVKVRYTDGTTPSSLADPGWIYHAYPEDHQTEAGQQRVDLADFAAASGVNRAFATPINNRRAVVIVDHA